MTDDWVCIYNQQLAGMCRSGCGRQSTAQTGRRSWGGSRRSSSPGAVLYCTALYCTVMHFTVLYCVRMMYAGNLMVSYQPLDDKPNFFRSIISNQAVTEEDVEFMLEEMDRLGIDL